MLQGVKDTAYIISFNVQLKHASEWLMLFWQLGLIWSVKREHGELFKAKHPWKNTEFTGAIMDSKGQKCHSNEIISHDKTWEVVLTLLLNNSDVSSCRIDDKPEECAWKGKR